MPDDATAGLAERLDSDLKDAMRAGEKVRLGTIRRARAALKNAEIEARGPLPDEAAVRVLRGLVKQHRESIDQFRAGGRDDLVARESRGDGRARGLPARPDGRGGDRRDRGRGDRGRGRDRPGRPRARDEGGDVPHRRPGRRERGQGDRPAPAGRRLDEHHPTDTAARGPAGPARGRPRGRPRPSAAAPTRRPTR